ncbi:hypothetical protein EKO27_g6363 [Xylaria grammica]|uniref:Uncharacterized protein n=1 Tax=Xylaria grammica TaxID=363999 RepID=A0A439D2X7_9PEZI|nr:hypothetical protein EKO27_g6363 [Xylaria grammica]
MEKKVALVKALGKVIWIQNDLFAKWCKRTENLKTACSHQTDVRDGDEFIDEAEAPEIEREGYLFGKRMLDDLEEEAEDIGSASACPFSGLAQGVSAASVTSEENEEPTVTQSDLEMSAHKDPA